MKVPLQDAQLIKMYNYVISQYLISSIVILRPGFTDRPYKIVLGLS